METGEEPESQEMAVVLHEVSYIQILILIFIFIHTFTCTYIIHFSLLG